MAGESYNDPLEISDDPSDAILEAAQGGLGPSVSSPATSKSLRPGQSSTLPLQYPPTSPVDRESIEISDTPPRPSQPRVLPPGFATQHSQRRATSDRNSANGRVVSMVPKSSDSRSSSSNAASSSGTQNGRVWNPPPRPWEKEARARAAATIATLQQPDADDAVPTIGGSTARMPNALLNKQARDDAIDLTNDDASDDDEPRVVSFKRGDIELDEQRNNGPVCLGMIPAIVLCMYGLPDPISSLSPAVQDPSQDNDPRWDRKHWPAASRWFLQPGYRPVLVKVKYPMANQAMAHQRSAGQWSYGGNRPPQQRGKPELAVSVVLSPRAHAEKQAQEGVLPQNMSTSPFYKAPFGTLADKFVDALEPLFARGILHCEARCRMVPPGRAGHFMHNIEMLLFCIRPNVSVVAERLSQHGIALESPRPDQFDSADYSGHPPLVNPHGNNAAGPANPYAFRSRFDSSMFTPGLGGRMVQSKEMTEEERKKQIEQVYDQLVSGDDLPLAKASPLIRTQLFPHQLKAISFLLERERERSFEDAQDTAKSKCKDDSSSADNAVSLWKVIRSRVDGSIRTFHNVVTQHQQSEEPEICRGAILADDMGLGKTITVIATIAATVEEARQFQRGKINRKRGKASDGDDDDDGEDDFSVGALASGLQAGSSKKARTSGSAAGKASNGKGKGKGKQKLMDIESLRLEHLVTRSKATLIVCPLTIVSNWEEQIKEHWKAGKQPSIYIYHGPGRSTDAHYVGSYDIVMTTYATLASEFANQHTWIAGGENEEESEGEEFEEVDANGDPVAGKQKQRSKKRKRHTGKEAPNTLQRIEWFRIVLDEAHTIKEARTMQCKAVCNLSAQRRLSLTGTPVQNRLDDLFAQVRFLRLYPFTERAVWNEHCAQRRAKNSITSRTNANQNNEPLEQMALVKVQTIMKFLTLRRTKASKTADGRPLLELPPKATHLITLQFDEKEQASYKALHQKYKEDFEEMQAAGSVGTNYATILQEILVLRMSCDHTVLAEASKDMRRLREGNTDISKAIAEDGLTRHRAARLFDIFSESAMADCANCGTDLSRLAEDAGGRGGGAAADEGEESKVRPVVTRCQHFFCSTCFAASAGAKWQRPKSIKAEDKMFCPACNVELSMLMDAVKLDVADLASIRSAHQSPGGGDDDGGDDGNQARDGGGDDFDYGSDKDDDEFKAALQSTNDVKPRSSRTSRASRNGFGADRDVPLDDRKGLSTKIRFLLSDLLPFSMCNPKSLLYDANERQLIHYAPSAEEKASTGYRDAVCIAQTNEDAKNYRPVKSVVFSQWTSMLDQVANALHRAGIRAVRLDGKMKRNERAAALEAFKMDDGVEVFLISLRAGGFGLNLVNACRAYNIEPAWNPAVEAQAMDRIHRLGQTRPVMVKKLIMKNTIEERMLDVQKRKQDLANQVGEKRGSSSKADERAEKHKELSMLLSGDGSATAGEGAGGIGGPSGSGGINGGNRAVNGEQRL